MDSDGFTLQGARRANVSRGDRNLDTFLHVIPPYSGTAADFSSAHMRSYGVHEHLGPDGSHPPGLNQPSPAAAIESECTPSTP